MEAGNSMPQTVEIENPKKGFPIHITQSVATKLEAEQKLQNESQSYEEQNENKPKNPKEYHFQQGQNNFLDSSKDHSNSQDGINSPDDIFRKKHDEFEEHQFNETCEMLESILGKPTTWVDDGESEIQGLRNNLIKCYRENPGQTLSCYDIAKKYQDFIFREQYRNILKSNNSERESSLPPPPYEHSPPYF